jgi:Tfp pilus assembly protein PilF
MNVQKAVKTLTKALRKDSDFYQSYQSNIAMAFQDEVNRNNIDIDYDKLHKISNNAAINFMNMWIKE